MEQRDLLKDQIERLGKVLAKILSDFLGFKSSGNATQGIEISNESLQSELDIDTEKIMAINKTELEVYQGQKIDKSDAQLRLQKAIVLLNIADEISKTMSFDRINKKGAINNVLQHNRTISDIQHLACSPG